MIFRAKLKIFTICLIAGNLFFCKNGWSQPIKTNASNTGSSHEPLAIVGGKAISKDNFKAEMARQPGEYSTEKKEQLLESIIRSELLFAGAKNAGYENDPEVIQAVKQAMVGRYLRDNLDPRLDQLKVSDEEAEAYYQTHQVEFTSPASVHAALIKIAVSPKAAKEKKDELLKRAEAARSEALALEAAVTGFGSVAVKYSDDQDSRYRGGALGWLQVGVVDGRRDRKVSEALFALKTPGQVSPVIVADDGYYIVKLIESKGATVKPYSQVKDGVRYHVVQDKKRKIESDFIEQLKSRIPVTINRDMLNSIPASVDIKPSKPPALPER